MPVAVRGAELNVSQIGAGPVDLVLVHGLQNDHTAWTPFVDRLDPAAYRVTSFDLVGCGASASPAGPERCTIDEYAQDLVALCDTLALDAPVAVGHSLGGAIVLRALLDEPDRFGGVVLAAPASTTGLEFLPDEAAFEALAHPTVQQQAALARAAFRHPLPDAEMDALLAVIARATREHIEGAAGSMRAFKVQPELASVDVPALLVCGDRDRHVPLANHLATQQAFSRCGLQVYFDVGHVPFVEVPDRFADDVQRFVAIVTSRP
jgi:sigma-B regulation protein RsbQ